MSNFVNISSPRLGKGAGFFFERCRKLSKFSASSYYEKANKRLVVMLIYGLYSYSFQNNS